MKIETKVLNEDDLKLVVKSKELGKLETNALKIKERVLEILPNYNVKNYSVENIDQAKEDKALLNKMSKALNDERIAIEKEFMTPFANFKETITETCNLIKEASSKIDEIVKSKEQEEKDLKYKQVQEIFENNVGSLKDLINLDRIFDERYLNKTYKLEDIEKEITEKLTNIRNGLNTVESLNTKFEVEIKNFYLTTLDINLAIQRNKELVEQEEKLVEQTKLSEIDTKKEQEKKLVEEASKVVIPKVIDEVQTYILKITAETSKLEALKKFLDNNEMKYEKVAI